MSRTALVPALAAGLVLVLWAGAADGQTDLKPRPSAAPSPTVSAPAQHSVAGRQRVTTRVAVGERAPDFVLERVDGTPLKLSKLRGEWVMLYFVARRESLAVVAPVAIALRESGVRTLAVVWEKSYVLARQFKGTTPPYTPLADPTGDIVSLYGLLGGPDGEAAQPGFVLIDPRGMVRLALLGQDLPGDDASRMVQMAVRGED